MSASSTKNEYGEDGSSGDPDPAKDDIIDIEAVQRQLPAASVETSQEDSRDATPCSPGYTVRLLKGDNGKFDFVQGARLINNLPAVVGFMELANAGDFAANVWNTTPVPIYATVLMAIGGSVAAVLCVFAFLDSKRAYENVQFLRQQRRDQKAERAKRLARGESTLDMDVYLAVTFRELGSEFIARWLLDLLMGGGAVLISIGTFMAIGGANRKVWLASNILSGYLGNAPIALYGLLNTCWASYIFFKAQGHVAATRNALKYSRAATLVKQRCRNVQVFCLINGTATTLGGVGSMLTATWWWGYVILAPVIVSSIFCNIWWRRRVGYSRSQPMPGVFEPLDPIELAAELDFAARTELQIRQQESAPMNQLVADPNDLPDVLAFLQRCKLFDDFCLKIVSEQRLSYVLNGAQSNLMEISVAELLALPDSFHPMLLKEAHTCVRNLGLQYCRSNQRYISELLGTRYAIARNLDLDARDVEK